MPSQFNSPMPSQFNRRYGINGASGINEPADRRREQGIALLVATLALMLVGVIAIAAIGHSGEESASAARARNTTRSIHAADAGIQFAINRVRQNPPRLDPVDIVIDGRSVQSRRRTVPGAQPIAQVGTGAPPEGYSANIGAGYLNEFFRVPVTAASPDGGISEIEAKLARLSANGASY